MIYTDGIHLVGDTLDELHQFAIHKLKFKLEWFQEKKHPHYDLTTKRAARRAIKIGAKKVSVMKILAIAKSLRKSASSSEKKQK